MRILVYGAGVLGSLYAARLKQAGQGWAGVPWALTSELSGQYLAAGKGGRSSPQTVTASLRGGWQGGAVRVDALSLRADAAQANLKGVATYAQPEKSGERWTWNTQAQLQGRWSLMFFGFTNCPDICPTTLTLMAQVEKALSDLPSPPQIVFVSVDPRRDTPAQVSNYIRFFSPSFVGLTGEQMQIDQLTKAMGVPVAIHDLGNGAYSVDHAATLFLLDPQARMTAIFSPPHTVETLSGDLRMVISKLKS